MTPHDTTQTRTMSKEIISVCLCVCMIMCTMQCVFSLRSCVNTYSARVAMCCIMYRDWVPDSWQLLKKTRPSRPTVGIRLSLYTVQWLYPYIGRLNQQDASDSVPVHLVPVPASP